MINRYLLLLALVTIGLTFSITDLKLKKSDNSIALEENSKHPSFDEFINIFGKSYSSFATHVYRKSIYNANLKYIDYLNQMDEGTAVYGVYEFADLTSDEMRLRYSGVNYDIDYKLSFVKNYTNQDIYVPKLTTPDTWNWTSQGAVASVKNQGSCGSCWAFSVSQNVQGQYYMKNKKLLEMSPQQSIDCDKVNYGCNGGWPYKAIDFLASHGGLSSLNDYPLRKNYSGPCDFNQNKAAVKIRGYMNVTQNETIVKDALYELGPLSVLMDFTGLMHYKSGVASPLLCSTWPDHALLLVGYGTQKNDDYWLIKNSWGASWGQSGYLMLARGKNKCAISQFATTAVLE